MTDPIVMTLTMIMVGQICLSVPLLLTRVLKSPVCLPLALFLLANGILALEPIVRSQFPEWFPVYTALSFPVLALLCPSLWFYVEGITANTPWKLQIKQARHYFLLWPGLIISVMILFLPTEIHTEIFINDVEVDNPFAIALFISILVMVLLWLAQCIYTISRIIHRLVAYRKQLKNLYSNNDDKELNWMNWLLLIAISTWLFSLATVFSSNIFDNLLFTSRTEALLSLLLIWCLAHFGLQQKPGLTELVTYTEVNSTEITPADMNINRQDDHASNNDGEDNKGNSKEDTEDKEKDISTAKKYQRSALGTTQSDRIAVKINTVMEQDKLYLDANLSLQKLASYVAISPNYISQTLNETLSINFFDFVNQWRIEAAKPKIIANQDTVLTIALEVGFNARSSFYKAFKQETGKTPSEFRKTSIYTRST